MRARPGAAALLLVLTGLLAPAAAAQAPAARSGGPTFAFSVVLSDLEPTRERDQRKAELFWASVAASFERGSFGARADLRAREGTFRDYYPGSVWLWEGYAWAKTPAGELRAGKLPTILGLDDISFGGDLFSLNGVGRNPDWGAGLWGDVRLGWNSLAWAARFVGENDHVAFEEEGRGVESDPGAVLRDGLEGKVSFVLDKGLWKLHPALSAGTARIVRDAGAEELRRSDAIAELTASLGPLSVFVEGLSRSGDPSVAREAGGRLGYDDAAAWLTGLSFELPTILVRYVYSEWRYQGLDGNERLHQPAVVWTPARGIHATIEYAARRLRLGPAVSTFNAFRFGLSCTF